MDIHILFVLGLFLETPVDYFDGIYWPFCLSFGLVIFMLNVIPAWRLQVGGNFVCDDIN